jgi:hypothetical protein
MMAIQPITAALEPTASKLIEAKKLPDTNF